MQCYMEFGICKLVLVQCCPSFLDLLLTLALFFYKYRISDDRKTIIDVEDQDIQVDYEQFAKMLLGAAL